MRLSEGRRRERKQGGGQIEDPMDDDVFHRSTDQPIKQQAPKNQSQTTTCYYWLLTYLCTLHITRSTHHSSLIIQ